METIPNEPDPNQLHLFLGQLAWNGEDTLLVRPPKPVYHSPEVAWPGEW